jgi:hypothetical protein
MLKFVKKEQLLSSVDCYVQNKEVIVLDVRRGCWSRKLENSKMKKTKAEFPMDKS